jgi:hypothetical protein
MSKKVMLFIGVIAADIASVIRKLNTLKMVIYRLPDTIRLKCASGRLISHSAPRG